MDTLQILIKARELIEKPEDWNNHSVHARDGERITRCARGALLAAVGEDEYLSSHREKEIAEVILRHMPDDGRALPHYTYSRDAVGRLCAWNNGHEHHEVLAAFDKAIAAAQPSRLRGGHGG